MMTEIIDSMPNLNGMDQQLFAQALVAQARSEGVELIGPDGLLTGLTKSVLGPRRRRSSPSTWAVRCHAIWHTFPTSFVRLRGRCSLRAPEVGQIMWKMWAS